jgi:hypothetical protein
MTASVADRDPQSHLLVFASESDAARVTQAITRTLGSVTMGQTRVCYNEGQSRSAPPSATRKGEHTPSTYNPSIGIRTAAGLIITYGVQHPGVPIRGRSLEAELSQCARENDPKTPQASLIPGPRLESFSFRAYTQSRNLGAIDRVAPDFPEVTPNVIISTHALPDGSTAFTEAGEAAFATWLLMAARRLS